MQKIKRKSLLYKSGVEYDDCANIVTDFCEKHDIDYHIKYGTQKRDNRKTENIFEKEDKTRSCELVISAD